MDRPGIEFAIMLHDPQLRKGLTETARRSGRSETRSNQHVRFRLWLAAALRNLAARVEPNIAVWGGSSASVSARLE
jgi:hypothetical protein